MSRLTKAQRQVEHMATVVFCPTCGHSVRGGPFPDILATGSEDCGRTLRIISLTEWREIADQSDLRLTEEGRRVLRDSA